jgi:Ca-activated chloride channel family protein
MNLEPVRQKVKNMSKIKISIVVVSASIAILLLSCGSSSDRYRRDGATVAESPKKAEMERFQLSAPPMPAAVPSFTRDQRYNPNFNTEAYSKIDENEFLSPEKSPLSTFSADVDTASYSNVRRFLNDGTLPPQDAVRIEEMINYFRYDYAAPAGDAPFATSVELAASPWNPKNRILRIGIAGKNINAKELPPRNIVFLIDVSGSMFSEDKLPLLKRSIKLLVNQLNEKDTVSIAVYAGASGLALPPTSGADKSRIISSLDELDAGGSTNGGEGIQLAYRVARERFQKGGINRVILATDGDFNVGTTDEGSLIRLIEKERESGIFLTVIGFGSGNLKDATMEKLADKGNGNYAYIDTIAEANKVLVEEAGSTLVTIAKDVKFQVEFNPRRVASYRLIGYENRIMKAEDFNDDTKDAGEIGAGHMVTALYEIVPVGGASGAGSVDPLKYQSAAPTPAADTEEIATVKIRYKKPDGIKSELLSFPVMSADKKFEDASADFRFASSVAAFGMLLRDSKFKGNATYDLAYRIADGAKGSDRLGYRSEFLKLIRQAQKLRPSSVKENGD